MSNITKPKPQAKRIDPKLKSQILEEILLPNASIPKIAKKYDLSSTTLYGWRIDHIKKLTQNLKNNFIELVPADLPKEDYSSKVLSLPAKTSNLKLSEISLIFNNNISLSLQGNINTSSLIKILSTLEEEESC